jgi:scyllo-inositol 2-dehydrogenase (NADP+)
MSNPIRTGLVSYGMSGMVFHAPLLYANKNFELSKIVERSRQESVKKYPDVTIVRSIEELCIDDSLELVVINTPDHTHYEFCKQALEHSKNVIVEKPFTLKYREAAELVELAAKKNLMLTVFQNRRWDGDFLTARKVIDQKLLGRLVSYEAHFDRYRNFIQEDTWKEDAKTGTGTLYNLGSHLIDQALVLFGKPESVVADIRALRDGSAVDDTFELWLQYPDVKVTVAASYLVREPGPRYSLHGTDGSWLKWGIDPQEDDLKMGKIPGSEGWGKEPPEDYGLLHTTIDGKDLKEKLPTEPGNYPAFYENVHKVLRENGTLAVKAEESAMVTRIIEAAFESQKSKKAVNL